MFNIIPLVFHILVFKQSLLHAIGTQHVPTDQRTYSFQIITMLLSDTTQPRSCDLPGT